MYFLASTAIPTKGAQSDHQSLVFPRSSLWLSGNEETSPNYQDFFLTKYTSKAFTFEANSEHFLSS